MENSQTTINLRQADTNDLTVIQQLFVDTIFGVCYKDYSKEQLESWTSSIKNNDRWMNKIKTQYFLMAEQADKIVGFGSLDDGSCIDLLYVHKDHQGQGIASKLFDALQEEALRQGALVLQSEVSKTAKPFFESRGFTVVNQQTIGTGDVAIGNFLMQKRMNT